MTSFLIDHLFESAVFALLMGALTLCFTNNRAGVRYGLWFAASVKFLVPFSAIVAAGNALRWDTAPALDLSWATPVATADLRLPNILLNAAAPLADMAAPLAATPVVSAYTASDPGLDTILLGLWLGGMAVLLCLWTLRWALLLFVRKASLPWGIPAAISVRFSLTLLEPGLVGIFRPVLLLP